MKWLVFFLATVLFAVFTSCCCRKATDHVSYSPEIIKHRDTHELLQGVLWVQTSAEYDVLSRLTYRQALLSLKEGLEDKNIRAALEQTGDFPYLPPAVILDIDGTVLDNSRFEGKLVVSGSAYNETLWAEWVAKEEAEVIPGAKEFLQGAEQEGVEIFYVTNRDFRLEKHTVANLRKRGLPVDPDGENLLSKNEKPTWTSDKSTRRAEVALRYRIILLIGDDLGDFVSGAKTSPKDRVLLSQKHGAMWGNQWFLLPNPLYGSWESALYDHKSNLQDSEILRRKIETVKPY